MIQEYYRQMRNFRCNIRAVAQQYDIIKDSAVRGAMIGNSNELLELKSVLISHHFLKVKHLLNNRQSSTFEPLRHPKPNALALGSKFLARTQGQRRATHEDL
jgi:hypothetical protein